MKNTIFFLMLLSFIGCKNMDNKENISCFEYPTVDKLMQELTIPIEHSKPRVYAFTDKVGGFWQGSTFDYNTNDGGYILDEGERLLCDFLAFSNQELINRRMAVKVEILPHQIIHYFDKGMKESITVLPNRKGLIIKYELSNSNEFNFKISSWLKSTVLKQEVNSTNQIFTVTNKEKGTSMVVYSQPSGIWIDNPVLNIPKDILQDVIETDKTLSIKGTNSVTIIVLLGKDRQTLEKEIVEIAPKSAEIVEGKRKAIANFLLESYCETNLPEYNRALNWNKIAGRELVVTQFGKGIWAGLPWFNQNWGRDTYISLPGISLVTGQFDDAKEIIINFTTYQQKDSANKLFGRIPNRVNSPKDIIYNTADGTPWLIRELAEYINYTGNIAVARTLFPVIKRSIEGAVKNFMDRKGFLTHDDADTWMDARIRGNEAWSPRGDKAVDIQALWYTQLEAGAGIAKELGFSNDAELWNELAKRVKNRFNEVFVQSETNRLYDHINTDNSPDYQIRPNQLFAITAPLGNDFISDKVQNAVIKEVVSKLSYPYGVASLSQDDPYFHPYHHDQIYHFDAAYHNGMCWLWLSGALVSGMTKLGYTDLAFEHTLQLAHQTIYEGMPGSLSELVEPIPQKDSTLKLSGTYSQAWSVAEFVRNFYQDYLGIKPQMLKRMVVAKPNLPAKINYMRSAVCIGNHEQIEVLYDQTKTPKQYVFCGKKLKQAIKIQLFLLNLYFRWYKTEASLNPGETLTFTVKDPKKMVLDLNNNEIVMDQTSASLLVPDPGIKFQKPNIPKGLKTLEVPDYLENIILKH
jgi:glycogen debranching enzyme